MKIEIKTKAQLLEFIRKESLKFLKENQAFSSLEDKVESVDASFVEVYEKKLDKLKSEEERAMEKEDYVELQKIKQEKVIALKRLIDAYKYKTKILEDIHDGLHKELEDLGIKGSGVFKNKPLNEFNNEDFQKGQTLKIKSISAEITFEKVSENNQYKILNSTSTALKPGDVIVMPNAKVGNSVTITVYRKIGPRFEEVGKPMIQNIQAIIKNPS